MSKKARNFFIYLLSLGLAMSLILFSLRSGNLTTVNPVAASTQAATELRGVWLTNVSSAVFFAPWGLNRAIKQLAQLDFNTLYPVVWNRGHTFYPSTVTQIATGRRQEPLLKIARLGSDVLDEIITQAHQRNLRVIPWFEYGLITPANSKLAQLHPDWLTHTQDGRLILSKDNVESKLEASEAKKTSQLSQFIESVRNRVTVRHIWLNPCHPEVQQFIKDLILEVVTNYDVDGIQLDDHFGMPVELGYDSFTIKLYQQEHGGKSPPSDPYDPKWMRWRAYQITKFMAEISAAVKEVKPQVKISLSPNPKEFSYRKYLQDWETWVRRGFVDELVLQVYRRNLDSFQGELSHRAVDFARSYVPVSVGISSGTWRNPVPIEIIQQQVEKTRENGFSGVSFFYWESLWGYITPESPQKRRRGFETLFSGQMRDEKQAKTN